MFVHNWIYIYKHNISHTTFYFKILTWSHLQKDERLILTPLCCWLPLQWLNSRSPICQRQVWGWSSCPKFQIPSWKHCTQEPGTLMFIRSIIKNGFFWLIMWDKKTGYSSSCGSLRGTIFWNSIIFRSSTNPLLLADLSMFPGAERFHRRLARLRSVYSPDCQVDSR